MNGEKNIKEKFFFKKMINRFVAEYFHFILNKY